MKKLVLAVVLSSFAMGLTAKVGSVTQCEMPSGLKFGAKSADCSPQAQQAGCDEYKTEPKLGPSRAIGCKTYTTPAEYKEAMKKAALSRVDPKAAAAAEGLTTTAAPGAAPQLPVMVTCVTPGQMGHFVTLANDCNPESQQKACDIYKDVPGLGPTLKPTGCQTFKDQVELVKVLTEKTKTGEFPGFGGGVVTCQTKAEKRQFAEQAPDCQAASQQTVCKTAEGIADPIACTEYPTDNQIAEALKKLPQKLAGLECQMKLGGIGFRVPVADCSQASKNDVCKPEFSMVKGCQFFKTPDELKNWSGAFINEAFVTCEILKVPGKTYTIPGRDCSPETQKLVCGMSGKPVKCELKEIEKLRKEMAAKQAAAK